MSQISRSNSLNYLDSYSDTPLDQDSGSPKTTSRPSSPDSNFSEIYANLGSDPGFSGHAIQEVFQTPQRIHAPEPILDKNQLSKLQKLKKHLSPVNQETASQTPSNNESPLATETSSSPESLTNKAEQLQEKAHSLQAQQSEESIRSSQKPKIPLQAVQDIQRFIEAREEKTPSWLSSIANPIQSIFSDSTIASSSAYQKTQQLGQYKQNILLNQLQPEITRSFNQSQQIIESSLDKALLEGKSKNEKEDFKKQLFDPIKKQLEDSLEKEALEAAANAYELVRDLEKAPQKSYGHLSERKEDILAKLENKEALDALATQAAKASLAAYQKAYAAAFPKAYSQLQNTTLAFGDLEGFKPEVKMMRAHEQAAQAAKQASQQAVIEVLAEKWNQVVGGYNPRF